MTRPQKCKRGLRPLLPVRFSYPSEEYDPTAEMQKGIKTYLNRFIPIILNSYDPTAEMQKGIKTIFFCILKVTIVTLYDPTAEMQKGIKTQNLLWQPPLKVG